MLVYFQLGESVAKNPVHRLGHRKNGSKLLESYLIDTDELGREPDIILSAQKSRPFSFPVVKCHVEQFLYRGFVYGQSLRETRIDLYKEWSRCLLQTFTGAREHHQYHHLH